MADDELAPIEQRWRRKLAEDEASILDMAEAEDLVLAIDRMVPFAHWITPIFAPRRFDTWFFIAEAPGDQVELHDGSRIILHKLGNDYDPTNKLQAIQAIHAAIAEGKFLTGLIYYNPNRKEFAEELNLCDIPLSELAQDVLQPPLEALEKINADMMK